MIGIFISIPLLWMVDFLNKPQQCQLNMKAFHLIYIIGLNAVLIFIPAMILPILYVVMYMKIKYFGNNIKLIGDSINRPSKTTYFSKSEIDHLNNTTKNTKNTNSHICLFTGKANDNFLSVSSQGFMFQYQRPSISSSKETNSDIINKPKEKISDFGKISLSNLKLPKSIMHKMSFSNVLSNQSSVSLGDANSDKNRIKNMKLKLLNEKYNFFLIQKKKRKNNLVFIIIITIVFFCCQLPVRIFLCWSYLLHHFFPITLDAGSKIEIDESHIFIINLISQITTLVYFLHCISNSIIYNILSAKFRRAFLTSIKNVLLFRSKFS